MENEIIRMYKELMPVTQIARKLGVSREAVYLHLRKQPDWQKKKETINTVRKATRIQEDPVNDQIRQLYSKKYDARRIARMLNLPQEEVFSRCYRMGLKFRDISNARRVEMVKRYMRGETYRSIAEDMKMTTVSVYQGVRKHFGKEWEKAKQLRSKIVKENTLDR